MRYRFRYSDDYGEPRSNRTGGGVGFTSLLAIAFIVLKLTKVINWSWWWVLSPIWITAGLAIIILIIVIIIDSRNNFHRW